MDCTIDRREDGERVLLEVSGPVDLEAALALRDALASEPADELLVDFTGASRLDDVATWVIADVVRRRDGRLAVRGLSVHHLQLLRYLHVDPAELGASPLGAEADFSG